MDLKLHKNDLSKNSNIDFANFANFTTAPVSFSDPFLDKSNNNSSSVDPFLDKSNNNSSNHISNFDPFGVSTSKNNNGSSNYFTATFDDDPFGEPLPARDEVNNNVNDFGARSNGADAKNIKQANNNKNNNKNVRQDLNVKYSEDYSKNFDNDLEEVLKRSLFDQ